MLLKKPAYFIIFFLFTLFSIILLKNEIVYSQEPVNNEDAGNAQFSTELTTYSNESPTETEIQALNQAVNLTSTPSNSKLKKKVYVYIPYWEIDKEADIYLQYDFMTHFIYHGISLGKNGVINKTNGPYLVWKGQEMTKIVKNARASGVKVIPNIVLFNSSNSSGLTDFLKNPEARKKGVRQIMNFLKNSPQPVDGVAIDFEYPASAQKEELTSFIKDLKNEMKTHNPKWDLIIAVAGYSYSGGGFDLKKLEPHIDGFFVMSYHLKDPRQAEKAGSTNPIGSLQKVADGYLEKLPAEKIVLGFPLYLAEWKTQDNSLRATKKPGTGGGKTVAQNECGLSGTTCTRLAQRYMKTYGRKYDSKDKAAYYSFYVCQGKNKGWHQVYFDDEQAFSDKFEMVNNKNLGGVGFWAQNYDKGYLDTWAAIYNKFADKANTSKPAKKPGFENPAPIPSNGCDDQEASPIPDSKTKLNLEIGLNGIGSTGNQNPIKKSIKIKIDIFAPDGVRISNTSKNITYDPSSGKYKGTIPIDIPKAELYNIFITSPSYLFARFDRNITPETTAVIPAFNLSAGDINEDGTRNLIDWNLVNACSIYNKIRNHNLCPDGSSLMTNSDLDSNGKVDLDDINLWRREFSLIPI